MIFIFSRAAEAPSGYPLPSFWEAIKDFRFYPSRKQPAHPGRPSRTAILS
jgi:hypothetical protein